jgi:hypothetical protein
VYPFCARIAVQAERRIGFEGAASSTRTEPFGADKKSSGFRWDMG